MTKILPKVASELIEIALSDLRTVEDMPGRYIVNMGDWHTPIGHDRCLVCLAGAVMAISLKVPEHKTVVPSSLRSNWMQLMALDALRNGNVSMALRYLGVHRDVKHNYNIPAYRKSSRDRFHQAMESMANDLREVGL